MICVDASLVVRAITDEEGHEKALEWFEIWIQSGETLVAPALLDYEITAALYRKVSLGDLQENEAIQALNLSQEFGILTYHEKNWFEQALLIARSFKAKTPYDFVYLVAAKQFGAELFTADKAFVEKLEEGYPAVKYYQPK